MTVVSLHDTGPWAHRPPLCGHRDGDQFGGPYNGGCPLPLVFSSSVRVSGLCGAYGPSNEHEGGRPVALKSARFEQQQGHKLL